MTDENVRANVAIEMAEAERLVTLARRYATNGDRETAANRLYYAAMHAAKALCFSQGIEPKTHRRLRRLVLARFVTTNLVPDWVDAVFGQLETERDLADYETGYRVPEDRYREREAGAARLLQEIRRYLETNGLL